MKSKPLTNVIPHIPGSIADRIAQADHMLTPETLANMLSVSPKSIYAWSSRGTLPVVRLGCSLRFDPVTTANWLRARSA